MALDIEKFKRDMEEWIESDSGKAFFEKERKKNEIKKGRYLRFEKWLEHNDFDKLMYKLLLEHGEEWREKCWHNGYEVHPNNKLQFVIDYVVYNHEQITVSQIDSDFPNQIWLFKGYYFQIIYGQGSIVNIYNADDFQLLLQV
jgi:hypothetical protein